MEDSKYISLSTQKKLALLLPLVNVIIICLILIYNSKYLTKIGVDVGSYQRKIFYNIHVRWLTWLTVFWDYVVAFAVITNTASNSKSAIIALLGYLMFSLVACWSQISYQRRLGIPELNKKQTQQHDYLGSTNGTTSRLYETEKHIYEKINQASDLSTQKRLLLLPLLNWLVIVFLSLSNVQKIETGHDALDSSVFKTYLFILAGALVFNFANRYLVRMSDCMSVFSWLFALLLTVSCMYLLSISLILYQKKMGFFEQTEK